MNFDFCLAKESFFDLFFAALVSLKISFISFFIGLIFGIILGYLNTRENKIFDFFINFYVSLIRGTPMLIQIMFFYYFMPKFGINLSPLLSASIAIGFNSAAYTSQTIKLGIISVGKDQVDAAKTLGLNDFQIFRYIVFPQTIKIIFPSLINESTTLIKDSSLASLIGVNELYKESRQIMNFTYDIFTIFFLMAFFYLFLTFIVSKFLSFLEKRFFYADN